MASFLNRSPKIFKHTLISDYIMKKFEQKTCCGVDKNTFQKTLIASMVVAALSVSSVYAQSATSSLKGDLVLEAGVSSIGIEVSIVDINTGLTRSVELKSDGSYNFPSLNPGTYKLELKNRGVTRITEPFTLRVGENSVLNIDFNDIDLVDTDNTETILVVGQRIQLQQGGEVGINITPEQMDYLPQLSRNFLAFADLAPGVTFSRSSNGDTNLQGGAQRSNGVNVFIDGVGQKDLVLKGGVSGQDTTPGNPFPQSAVGQYRVISQNYKAEFEQVSSVAITAVTRSGTNEFEGNVFFDHTDEGLRQKTPSEKANGQDKVETKDQQFGASFGGAIIKDELHYFVAYEGKRIESPVEVFPGAGFAPSELPSQYADLIKNGTRTFEEDLFFGKIDWSPTDDDLIQFSIKIREETGINWNGGTQTEGFKSNINNDDIRMLLRYEHYGDSWVNDFKLTYEDSKWAPTPTSFGNVSRFETASRDEILWVGPSLSQQEKGQEGSGFKNDFTWTGFDDHDLKFGVVAKWIKLKSLQQNLINPLYHYNVQFDHDGDGELGEFNDVIPYRLEIGQAVESLGNGSVTTDAFQLGIFIQDDWQVNSELEISYGVRWDYEEVPSYLDYITPSDATQTLRGWSNLENANYNIEDYLSDGSNRKTFKGAFAPRIGFNYSLTDSHTLFGGFGRSYDRNQYDFLQLEQTASTFTVPNFFFDTGDADRACDGCIAWDPVYSTAAGRQQLVDSIPEGGNREVFLVDNDLKNPYSDQYSLGIRSSLENLNWEVGISRIESRDGFAWLLGNRREDGAFFESGAIFGAPFGNNPSGNIVTNILLGTNGLETNSNSAYIKLSKPYTPESGWGVDATYTHINAEENRFFNETFSLDFESVDSLVFLDSAGVRDHALVTTGVYDLPYDFKLGFKFTYRSEPTLASFGAPGVDFRQWTPTTIEADGGEIKQLDVSLTKVFELGVVESDIRLRIDVINLLNTKNYTGFEGFGGSENFGQRINENTGGNLPRTIKLSASWSF